MWLSQREQSRGDAGNFRSGRVLGRQADPFLWLYRFIPLTCTHPLHGSTSRDRARHWGDSKSTRQTWVLHTWSSRASWGERPQTIRQAISYLIIIVISAMNAMKLYRTLWGSDERHRPKTEELTRPPSWTDNVVGETKIPVTCVPVHCCSHWATGGAPVFWQGSGRRIQHYKDSDDHWGGESKWPHLCSFHGGTTTRTWRFHCRPWTLTHALQEWKMISVTLGWEPKCSSLQ